MVTVPPVLPVAALPEGETDNTFRETNTSSGTRSLKRRPDATAERPARDAAVTALMPSATDKPSSSMPLAADRQGDRELPSLLPGDNNNAANRQPAPDTAHHHFMETLQAAADVQSSPAGSDITTGTTAASPTAGAPSSAALRPEGTGNTSPVPQHPAHMPLPVVEQLAVHIRKISRDNAEHIRIQLEPAQLGVVEISMTIAHDGTVQAVLSADKSDTLQWLKQDAAHLQKMLEDSGLSVGMNGMQFEDRSQQQQNRFVAYQEAFQDAVSSRQISQATLHLGFAAPLPSSLAAAPDHNQRLDVKI
jgi:flagellar hook-length control protein FliK